jgi:Mn2+/Fe2+ NRAMP family transporter
MKYTPNPYARRPEDAREPPQGFGPTLKFLGPGLILAGSVVGSGEIILTTTLGATVGFTMLWWILFSCWSKSVFQAELGRYVISSGDTGLKALNRVPGKLGGVSWVVLV